ncbi:flagellar motor protein MotB [Sinimarinibacterium sp. CAU 1509]|uniref:flagellar motor protein MotB n=1 Tax=Sinimarinibacterium sp. CAU 1509 TaxID=2562283 RepID=UPI0010AC3DEC|nr:flagellar motor protein MotB [Sinimarinibacterium sp. CAU 1509]TJY62943.1 flagellar motor protein MotB [Sinimarinibacterium sp. CAU 1509]
MAESSQSVVIRRVKKVNHGGHHGGAWKVAYADFVTAMMAFFMVMWIVGISDKEKRAAISDYFNNPSMSEGQSQTPAAGANGPGGASTSMIQLGGAMDLSRGESDGKLHGSGSETADAIEEAARELDRKRLEALREELLEAIAKSQALEPFKDQLLLDITSEGLRIQIVDKRNRPMFDLGGAKLRGYTSEILQELARFIEPLPNHISISGHTDVTHYGSVAGYSNWELSSDRANAARRALIAGGMSDTKIARVVGLSSTVLFDKERPDSPINRRISIVVMNRETESEIQRSEEAQTLAAAEAAADPGSLAGAAAAPVLHP